MKKLSKFVVFDQNYIFNNMPQMPNHIYMSRLLLFELFPEVNSRVRRVKLVDGGRKSIFTKPNNNKLELGFLMYRRVELS